MFRNIYRGKRVFVTGHTGFKGSWLSLWLDRLGADVVGYSLDIPTQPSHFELLDLKIQSITADVLDKQRLITTIEKHQPEIVFHLAAQSLVRRSYADPVATFETNVMGTVNILEACRRVRTVKAVVNVTSDKCYENQEVLTGYAEDDPMGGDDPYSASKGCAELVSHAYRRSFLDPAKYRGSHSTLLATARAGNVVGGGDWAEDRLMPDIMKAASMGETVLIRNPRSVRPWQHVLESLSGYLHLGSRLLEGRAECADCWNFGPASESSITVEGVVGRARGLWDAVRYEIREDPEAVHETQFLTLDSTKARKRLGWKPVWNADTTFARTIGWYKQYYGAASIASADDVTEYERDAGRAGVEWAKE